MRDKPYLSLCCILVSIAACSDQKAMQDRATNYDDKTVDTVTSIPDAIENGNRLWLESTSGAGTATIKLRYSKDDTSQGPRVAELRLSLSRDLTFVSATAGAALVEAGKELIAQTEEDGVVRLVALSAGSLSEIGSGVLATVEVKRSGAGPSTAELLLDKPLFAPQAANEGLVVDARVTF